MTGPAPKRRSCSPWTLMGCGCGTMAMIGIAFIFFLLGGLLLRERQDPRWSMPAYAQCQDNLHRLDLALENYRQDHHQFPADLRELTPNYISSADWLTCPLTERKWGTPYRYSPMPNAPADPLITCDNHAQGPIVLLHNGRVRLPDDALHRALHRQLSGGTR